VDPFSHIALGRTLAALHVPRARGRGTLPAVMLGALAPDVDAVLMPFGWDIYLRAHEIGTHSIVGSLGIAALTALVVRLCLLVPFAPFRRAGFLRVDRDHVGRVLLDPPVPLNPPDRGRYLPLVAAAWAGCLSHLALDVLSGARVRLGWPLADSRMSLPFVAMGEPIVIAIFLAGWIVLFAFRKRPPQRQRLTAIVVLAVIFLFLDLKAVLLRRAMSSLGDRSEQIRNRVVEARWASLTEWYVYDRTPDAIEQRRVRAGGEPVLLLSWPIGSEPPLVSGSRSLSTVRNFLRAHELGFAVQRPDPTGGTQVLWSDIRYCWAPVGDTRIACGLWFGGTINDSGRAVRQRVEVGRWIQTRAP
jgi:membrane-bound metal-dependent hydrolase YbcI (DUF457 family)